MFEFFKNLNDTNQNKNFVKPCSWKLNHENWKLFKTFSEIPRKTDVQKPCYVRCTYFSIIGFATNCHFNFDILCYIMYKPDLKEELQHFVVLKEDMRLTVWSRRYKHKILPFFQRYQKLERIIKIILKLILWLKRTPGGIEKGSPESHHAFIWSTTKQCGVKVYFNWIWWFNEDGPA